MTTPRRRRSPATTPDGRRRWQLLLTGLVDAIVADAIEASALEFPDEHPFWGAFTRDAGPRHRRAPCRRSAIGSTVSAAGPTSACRRSATCRSPSATPASTRCASGTGRRGRRWPSSSRDVTVAADEYLAGVAGDLTLAEMVAMLGRRADGLAELWNDWGRIRPLLLDEA